jgi:hypothetical protein
MKLGITLLVIQTFCHKNLEALANPRHCLEELTLFGSDLEIHGEDQAQAIGALLDFQKLRKITIYAHGRFGPDLVDGESESQNHHKTKMVDIVHASLGTVLLLKCDFDVLDKLRKFSKRQGGIPVLKSITISISQP